MNLVECKHFFSTSKMLVLLNVNKIYSEVTQNKTSQNVVHLLKMYLPQVQKQ